MLIRASKMGKILKKNEKGNGRKKKWGKEQEGTRTLLRANFEFLDLHDAAKINGEYGRTCVAFYAIGPAVLKRI